jgi:uncharacterized protein (DUF1684 family)
LIAAPLEYPAEIERWRRRRAERLTAEDGWLSLTGLFWLSEGENPVGADPSSAITLPAEHGPPRAGAIRLESGRAFFEPAAGEGVRIDGAPAGVPRILRSDLEPEPTTVEIGPIRLQLLERGGRLAVRVRDRENPARRTLRPIPFFPVSAEWRVEARFEPATPPRRIPLPSVVGTVELETCPGALVFSAAGRELRVDPVLERGETDWWIVFGDETNGTETYRGGRFVYAPPPVGGRTILDFNKAYNPPCVFTPYSTCPLPPPQNRLPIRVEAGERAYGA